MCYTLQKYGGMRTKHTCPACGRPKCFVYYVNEEGKALHRSVGRCDHQAKCGYHYKPADFKRDNPTLRISESWSRPMEKVERRLWTIRKDEVTRFRSNESTLLRYLAGLVGYDDAVRVATMYKLGATESGDIIFWQIDKDGKVRTGKVMTYGEDGHRIKTSENDKINWMHSLMKRDGLLPQEWELTQCLFGEHLLKERKDSIVCIVESEKTAILMAMVAPEYTWLASGGKYNLSGDRFSPLMGRKVLLYPDADAVDKWQAIAEQLNKHYDVRVADLKWSAEDIEKKLDIADVIINKLQHDKD